MRRADDQELGQLLEALGAARLIPRAMEARPGEMRAEIYQVDITADLNDEDKTGYSWTFLDEARDHGRISLGALVVERALAS